MKKIVLLTISIISISFVSNATVHVVQVSNFQFTPSNIPDVVVGDVIRWVWVSGSHTTTDDNAIHGGSPTSVPAGAATWNSNINSTTTSFEYTVTVAGVYNYLCQPHAANMRASFTATSVLPIKLASFNVTGSSGKAVVRWNTMSEQNTDYFSVRRSLDGTTYTEIAEVPAAGTSVSERSYSYTDNNIVKGRYYYYNIAVIDRDKNQQYSDTKLFKEEGTINKLVLSLSPNPITGAGHLMMSFNAEKEGKMEVSLITAQGQVIIKDQLQAFPGVNNGHLHLGSLPAGIYSLVCILNGTKETHRIIFK